MNAMRSSDKDTNIYLIDIIKKIKQYSLILCVSPAGKR